MSLDNCEWFAENVDQMNIMGLYRVENWKKRIIQYVSFVAVSYWAAMNTLDLMYNCKEPNDYVESLEMYVPVLATLYFYICVLYKQKSIRNFVDDFRSTFPKHNFSDDAELFIRKLIKAGYLVIRMCLVIFSLGELEAYFRRSLEHPHDGKLSGLLGRCYYPYDLSNIYFYLLSLTMQMLSACTVTSMSIPVSVFIASCLIHLGGQLSHLVECLNKLPSLNYANRRKELKYCIKQHQNLIRIANELQDVFSTYLIMQQPGFALTLSVSAYHGMAMDSILNVDFAVAMVILMYALVEGFFLCWFGQLIINESTLVGETAYTIPWYEFTCEEIKDLSLIINESKTPLSLKFFGSATLSLLTYKEGCSTGYSICLFLAKLCEPGD